MTYVSADRLRTTYSRIWPACPIEISRGSCTDTGCNHRHKIYYVCILSSWRYNGRLVRVATWYFCSRACGKRNFWRSLNNDNNNNNNITTKFQSLDRLGRRGDMTDDSAGILFQSFLQEALVSSSGTSVVQPAFLLTASPSLHCALKESFGEAVVTCDMPEPS